MIVVSDATPLNYLIALDKAYIIPELFVKLYVPPAVIEELSHVRTPEQIRQWIRQHPTWLVVQRLSRPVDSELVASLDQGEAEAIQLAEEQHADALILDESKGRAIAKGRGIPLTGTLGILGLAYQKHRLENPLEVLAAMRERGFRIRNEPAIRFENLLTTRYAR